MTTSETTTAAPAAEATPKAAPKPQRVNWRNRYEELKDEYDEFKAVKEGYDELCDELTTAVSTWHDEQHDGAFRHCPHPVCDAANDLRYA